MKLFAPLAQIVVRQAPITYPVGQQWGFPSPQQGYLGYSRAYMHNEIVFSAVEMLATSVGEPRIVGRKWQRNSPQIRDEEQRLLNCGLSHRDVKERMIENGFFKDMPSHPLIQLLDNPNPWISRGQMWGTVVMDRCLAGNAYLLKARVQNGPMQGAIAELWRLRPDRVRIIPSAEKFIEGYEYNTGQTKVTFPPEDIIQFKTRNPLNDYYGMPPLMAIARRLDIDEYMKTFLSTFFERGGTGPGSILSVKQKLSQEAKDDIRDRFRNQFGAAGGFHEMMVLDQAESTYQQMGLNRGLRDALPAELDHMQEARIAMVFGIPGSILGLLIGYESSSYANKRQDWQVFWDLTMTPLLSDLDDALNLQLVPEFNGIDEVLFDLSDIRALQEDVDKIQDRHRKNFSAGVGTLEETRELVGLDPNQQAGVVYVPRGVVPTDIKLIGVIEEKQAQLPATAPPKVAPAAPPTSPPAPKAEIVEEVHCPKCGRWLGRNMNAGATAFCPKCKEVPVNAPPIEPRVVTKTVEYHEDGPYKGRIKEVVEVSA